MHHIVYKVTCRVTHRYYIGLHSTANLDDGYLGSGILIRRSIKKHGKDAHVFEMLDSLATREDAAIREKTLIQAVLGKDPLLLNISEGGNGGNKVVWTEARRRRQSQLMSNMPRTDTHCANISASLKGHALSDERKCRISESLTGRRLDKARREKLRLANLGRSEFRWTIASPDGRVFEVDSLKLFCEQYSLKYLSLYKSLGRAPISRGPAKGWQVLSRCQK